MTFVDRARVMSEIRKEREERTKARRPWTQAHHDRGFGRPRPLRAPRPRREPGECACAVRFSGE